MAAEREPYVGPRPFEAAEADRFFGREREATDLLSLTVAESIVLFYAPSGAGKTSLLRARLIAGLEERGFEVLPIARVVGAPGAGAPEGANGYVWNALLAFSATVSATTGGSEIGAATTLPAYLEARPRALDEQGEPLPRVLIFDQFEEIFTTGRWQERRDFFAQLGQALDGDRHLRLVLALREESLARLDPYARLMPDRLRIRLLLDGLRPEQALLAVTGPLSGTGRRFAPGVAEELIASLRKVRRRDDSGAIVEEEGELVEPFHLQLVCAELWHRLPVGVIAIEREHLETVGDVDRAFALFYEREIAQVAEVTGVAEGTLRRFFERALVTPQGTRALLFHGEAESAGLPEAAIEKLLASRLLTEEIQAGAGWLEISHDRFLAPIREANDAWWQERKTAVELEAAAEAWAAGRPDGRLLSGRKLAIATRWLESPEAKETESSETLRRWLAASHKARRRRRAVAVSLALFAAVAVVLSWRALRRIAGPAEARQLAAEARLDRTPVRALLLAVEAVHRAQETGVPRLPESEEALRVAIGRFIGFIPGNSRDLPALGATTIDGRFLALPVRGGGIDLVRLDERVLSARPLFLSGQAGAPAKLSALAVFDPDGNGARAIAAGDRAGRLSLWRVSPGGAVVGPWDLATGGEPAERLAWSADGRLLLDAPLRNRPRLWRAAGQASEEAVELLCPSPQQLTTRSALDPQGLRLAAGCDDGSLRLWDLTAADPAGSGQGIARRGGSITALAWSEDGLHLAAGDAEGATLQIERSDPERGAVPLPSPPGRAQAEIEDLAWSADGRRLAAASSAGGVRLWDLGDGTRETLLPSVPPFAATRVAFDPAGRWLLGWRPSSKERLGAGSIWPIEGAASAVSIPAGDLAAAAWCPTGGCIALADGGSSISLWQPDGNRLTQVPGRGTAPGALSFAPGGWLRAETPEAPEVLYRTARLSDRTEPATLPAIRLAAPSSEGILRVQSVDNRLVAEGLDDGRVRLRLASRPGGRVEEIVLRRHLGELSAAAFSPSDRWLATGDGAGNLRLWDLEQQRRDPRVFAHRGRITAVAWSLDGRFLAAASADGTASLWAFQGGQPEERPHRLYGHEAGVTALAWSHDGSWLATGSMDRTIRLWNLAEGLPGSSVALQGHAGAIRALAFEPDGRHLRSAEADGRTLRWRMDQGDLLDLACRLAGRNLNDDEWRQFVRPIVSIVSGVSNRKTCPEL